MAPPEHSGRTVSGRTTWLLVLTAVSLVAVLWCRPDLPAGLEMWLWLALVCTAPLLALALRASVPGGGAR